MIMPRLESLTKTKKTVANLQYHIKHSYDFYFSPFSSLVNVRILFIIKNIYIPSTTTVSTRSKISIFQRHFFYFFFGQISSKDLIKNRSTFLETSSTIIIYLSVYINRVINLQINQETVLFVFIPSLVMAFQRHMNIFFFFLLFSCFLFSSQASKFYVGGRDGWVLHPSENYTHWTQKNRFQINDTLGNYLSP